jgi:ParB-like chromosome segregation protein Spo0J
MNQLPFEVHPAAELFPLMSGDAFDELIEDVRKHGVKQPIVFWQGKLLDGRNRSHACLAIGIDPLNHACDLEEENVDPVEFVLTANLHRRHLSTSERAMVAAKCRKVFDDEAAERKIEAGKQTGRGNRKVVEILPQPLLDESTAIPVVETLPPPERGKSRDKAGELLKVSGKSVDAATKVLKSENTEVIKAVETGQMTVNAALKIVDPPKPKPIVAKPVARKEKPATEDKGDFVKLREVFDSMDQWHRERALDLWSEWLLSDSTDNRVSPKTLPHSWK